VDFRQAGEHRSPAFCFGSFPPAYFLKATFFFAFAAKRDKMSPQFQQMVLKQN